MYFSPSIVPDASWCIYGKKTHDTADASVVPTVDGRNPAPPGMYKTLSRMGYLPYQLGIAGFLPSPVLISVMDTMWTLHHPKLQNCLVADPRFKVQGVYEFIVGHRRAGESSPGIWEKRLRVSLPETDTAPETIGLVRKALWQVLCQCLVLLMVQQSYASWGWLVYAFLPGLRHHIHRGTH